MRPLVRVAALLLAFGAWLALPRPAVASATAPAAAPPAPWFPGTVNISRTAITLGEAFQISVAALNAGGSSPDGRISVSFPALDHPTDVQWVVTGSADDQPGYSRHWAGRSLADSLCQPMAASYLAVEYGDNDWVGANAESNTFTVTVAPRDSGAFHFYVRATLAVAGETCQGANALPPEGEAGYVDQQGWAVKRFSIRVVGTAAPVPSIGTVVSPTIVTLGQQVSVSATVANGGGPSGDGRIVVGIPSFTDPADSQHVSGHAGGLPGFFERPAGSPLVTATCQPMVATYLVAETVDEDWRPGEVRSLVVGVRPKAVGTLVIEIRATLHWTAMAPCAPVTGVPSNNATGTDQQGFAIRHFFVTVLPRPPEPNFTTAVEGIPTMLTLGESFTLHTSVHNDGSATDDGRIVLSFPSLDQPDDAQWVSAGPGDDSPGDLVRPAGAALVDCRSAMTAEYLVCEYVDDDWQGSGAETNTLSVTVEPQAVGTFAVDVRATMRDPGTPGCAYVNAIPGGTGPVATDQQDWEVRRFEVTVLPASPPGPATTVWSLVRPPPGGPSGRFSASAVYHPQRDQLVLYGGSDGHYWTDVWALPLAPGSAWTQLSPGGPIPRQRIMTSMIHNPAEDHLVVFGGLYNFYLNDVTALALSPLVWWFPATPLGTQPTPRFGHAAVYDPLRHRMLVVGGYDGSMLNDVWEYRLPGDGRWTRLSPSGTPMPPRTQHTAVYDPPRDRVIVFGGDGGVFMDDVWELTLGGTPAWNRLSPDGTPPSGRREHTMIYDPDFDRVVIFAGFDGARRNDLWALWLTGAPRWEELYSSSHPPSPRAQPVAVHDPTRHRMVVFGGQVGTNAYSNEVWALDPATPTPTLVSFAGADATPDRVRLSWQVADPGAIACEVRRAPDASGPWEVLGMAMRQGDRLAFEDREVAPGARYLYRLAALGDGAVLDEVWVQVPGIALALSGASPNPAMGALSVAFALPAAGQAALEVFDLRGRLVARREVGGLGPGEHQVAMSEGGELPPGVYLVRLTRGDRALTAKVCLVR